MRLDGHVATLFTWCFLAAILLSSACGTLAPVAGGGTDIDNARVFGYVVTQDGLPAKNTQVSMYPASYNPLRDSPAAASFTVETDVNGRYVVSCQDTGAYLCTMVHNQTRTRAVSVIVNVVRGDSNIVPVVTLCKPSTVKVAIQEGADMTNGAFYIPGTTLFTVLKNVDKSFVVIDSVPAGLLPSINYYVATGSLDRVIRFNVVALSGDTTNVSLPVWQFSKKLALNTTIAGAGVLGRVTNFPVLVRLTKANFNFGQAKGDGTDVRFTKADNTFLPYEIERWDSASQQAELWVKVDTVLGNDSSQFIQMYWGTSTSSVTQAGATVSLSKCFVTQSLAKSNNVFDTANGFAGAWHLDNTNNDATLNNYHATNFGAIDTVGIIGTCKKFRGNDSIRIDGLMGKPTSVTLSAWASLDTVTYISGADVISIGNAVLIRMDDNYQTRGTQGDFSISGDTLTDCIGSGQYFAKTGWHYLVYSYDKTATTQSLYIDGMLYGVHSNVNPINYATVGSATYIGVHGHGSKAHNFVGLIDEVRVDNVPRSADWVRLCYMNQQLNDRLVVCK